jgi:hypothetical protein
MGHLKQQHPYIPPQISSELLSCHEDRLREVHRLEVLAPVFGAPIVGEGVGRIAVALDLGALDLSAADYPLRPKLAAFQVFNPAGGRCRSLHCCPSGPPP